MHSQPTKRLYEVGKEPVSYRRYGPYGNATEVDFMEWLLSEISW